MLAPIINKVGALLKVPFTWNKVDSPESTTNARSESGNAAATSGANSPIHFGDVHNHLKKEIIETVSYTASWKALFDAFSPGTAQRLGNMINNPNAKTHRKTNLDKHKKWVTDRFAEIKLDHSDPRAAEFNRVLEAALASIDDLDRHGDQALFENSWSVYLEDLKAL